MKTKPSYGYVDEWGRLSPYTFRYKWEAKQFSKIPLARGDGKVVRVVVTITETKCTQERPMTKPSPNINQFVLDLEKLVDKHAEHPKSLLCNLVYKRVREALDKFRRRQ